MERYYSLGAAMVLLVYGWMCYYLQKYEIYEGNKLFKCRPSIDNVLIRLKLFKYDWRFNYFLLIPYLLAWTVFLATIVMYCFYWCGIKELEVILLQKWFLLIIVCLFLAVMIYIGVIQIIINLYNGKAKRFSKEEKKILKEIMSSKKENKDKQKK